VVGKAQQLITNSNYAENLIQVNRCKIGSFTIRPQGARLDYQMDPKWHYETMKRALEKGPLKRRVHKITKQLLNTKKSLFGANKTKKKKKNK
jgi:hypothetical protein